MIKTNRFFTKLIAAASSLVLLISGVMPAYAEAFGESGSTSIPITITSSESYFIKVPALVTGSIQTNIGTDPQLVNRQLLGN